MKSAGKARNNGLYRHIRTSKEIIRNLLNDSVKSKEWIQIIQKWEGYVRKVVDNKGKPPMLY
jgi:hypothetical protein